MKDQKNGKGADKSVKLPSLANKFSSWTSKEASLNELDELLMEHDLLMNPQTIENGTGQKPHAESRGSNQDDGDPIDFEEVMDEFGESSGDRDQSPLINEKSASKKE